MNKRFRKRSVRWKKVVVPVLDFVAAIAAIYITVFFQEDFRMDKDPTPKDHTCYRSGNACFL